MGGEVVRPWRGVLAALRDPVRRHQRLRRRTRRSVAVRSLAALGLAWVTSVVGSSPGVELGEVFWGTATGIAALAAAGSVRRLWQLERAGRPQPPAEPPPLPPAGSSARQPLERLASRERALGDLLALLRTAAGDVAADAAAAAAALRDHAARIVAVEAAQAGAPAEARAGLEAALAALRLRLDEGVSAYDRLVAAAADAVAAGNTAPAGGHAADAVSAGMRRLEDAADALLGLARGLREVSGTGDHPTPA
jgi:hypothetical protein